MIDKPFTFKIPIPGFQPSRVDHHVTRHLSDLKGRFIDTEAYDQMLIKEDVMVYEVYEIRRPEVAGEMLFGIDIIHPGKVGDEFFMTKGHYHAILEASEIYYCLQGEGFMVMETPEGNTAVEKLSPNSVIYVPPRWAHRTVCTGRNEDLVNFYIYPADAGQNYGTLEQFGFLKIIIERNNRIEIIDNPNIGRR